MSNSFVMTLNRHILQQERLYPQATGSFTRLLSDIALAAKVISYHVNKAGLLDVLGSAGSENVFGEKQQKLDVFANEALIRSLQFGGSLCAMASEEEEEYIEITDEALKGKYICCFDPLDGSSNIDVNVSIGTIFSIFRRISPENQPVTIDDILQPGYSQVCAGYVVYGSSTMLVYTTGNGVYGFTLDPIYGSFILSHRKMTIPSKGSIYSINESNFDYWDEGVRNYVRWARKSGDNGKPMNSRYIGSLVADFHRTLLKGGIFLYPGDHKKPGNEKGKLRLMYEANPLAFICYQAGGRASDGLRPILDIQPEKLHQRTPLIIGSREDVQIAEQFIQGKRTS
jgi:fructose-1,6-bisphosphatase I